MSETQAIEQDGMTKVIYFLMSSGQCEVHTPDCSTGRRHAKSSKNQYGDDIGRISVPSRLAFVRDFWNDQICESEEGESHWMLDSNLESSVYDGEVSFHETCLKDLVQSIQVVEEPAPPAKPVTAKRDAKRALATLLVTALADAVAKLDDDANAEEFAAILSGMSREEAKRCASQWFHHLPVNREEWPAVLPKPDRSDWK